MFLDALTPKKIDVGYGELGLHGHLGYEGKRVRVGGENYMHAFSTHPPGRLVFHIGRAFSNFACQVALNDDVLSQSVSAHFTVLADRRPVAVAHNVRPGNPPRTLTASIQDAELLELVVRADGWEYCHAVWLDPQLDATQISAPPSILLDCLGRTEIIVPTPMPKAFRCVATVASAGFASLLDDSLGSFLANSVCHDALRVVFIAGDDPECRRVAEKYGALIVHVRPLKSVTVNIKSVLYSVARVIDAKEFLCLDADTLVLHDLRPIFSAIEALPEARILVCREGNSYGYSNLEDALIRAYYGQPEDFSHLLDSPNGEAHYPLVVNDGVFAGSQHAFLALDTEIRSMKDPAAWIDKSWASWRNQFIFNLALARLGSGVELDPTYNLQLHVHDASLQWEGGRLQARWQGQPVRVLHFSGVGRKKYPEWRGLFAHIPDPVVGPGGGHGYADFLVTLRSWLGRFGQKALSWSFYGCTDGQSAHVADPSTFPLFALLHFLIRANGCTRVIETGTAMGVSAACLASAVMHRQGGRVVTLDTTTYPSRDELWSGLPSRMRNCIETRQVDALTGMKSAYESGERYDAALLDTVHTEEHVWSEFQLASRLVCPGGLILIHDPIYLDGTVEGALRRIEADGYNVVRLWTAEGGVAEDDHLGLAVIENRVHPHSSR